MDAYIDLDPLIEEFERAVGALWAQLDAGAIDLPAWQRGMEDLIGEYHFAAYMVGQGAELLPGDSLELLGRLISEQDDYLRRFVIQIQNEPEFRKGWEARARMYAQAVKVPFWAARTQVLPLPAMPAEGTQCLTNCRCHWRIEPVDEAAGDFDAYWEVTAQESCQTCVERNIQWYPVQIRDWDLVLTPMQGYTVNEYGPLITALAEKHLAGGKFEHDQSTHGLRYGPNMSTSRARQMAREQPERWADYKRRSRARAGKDGVGSAGRDAALKVQAANVRAQLQKTFVSFSNERLEIRGELDRLRSRSEQLFFDMEKITKDISQPDLTIERVRELSNEYDRLGAERKIVNDRLYDGDPIEKMNARHAAELRELLAVPASDRGSVTADISDPSPRAKELSPMSRQGSYDAAEFISASVHKDLLPGDQVKVHSTPITYHPAYYVPTDFSSKTGQATDAEDTALIMPNGDGVYMKGGIDAVTSAGQAGKYAVHEMGHWIEQENPRVGRAVESWMKENTSLARHSVYEDGTWFARKEGRMWIRDYAGYVIKFETGWFASEVLSVALEQFFDNPAKFASLDPELFDFVYALLRGGFGILD